LPPPPFVSAGMIVFTDEALSLLKNWLHHKSGNVRTRFGPNCHRLIIQTRQNKWAQSDFLVERKIQKTTWRNWLSGIFIFDPVVGGLNFWGHA
jgi:hypothetical protein